MVNDVTILGDVEAGNNREDYFVGDGFTGNFPLRHKMFRQSGGQRPRKPASPWQNDTRGLPAPASAIFAIFTALSGDRAKAKTLASQ
jgi:hypothetical protein